MVNSMDVVAGGRVHDRHEVKEMVEAGWLDFITCMFVFSCDGQLPVAIVPQEKESCSMQWTPGLESRGHHYLFCVFFIHFMTR